MQPSGDAALLILASDELILALDPRHGAEVVELVDRRSAARPLSKPGFIPLPQLAGELDESTWTERYRGGWQVLLPNAGAACTVDGVRHGFHGIGSVAPWSVCAVDPATAVLTWIGHGLIAERRFAVDGDAVRVRMVVRTPGEAPVPLLVVEHLALGRDVIAPDVRVDLAGGWLAELPSDAPADVRRDGRPWPAGGLRLGVTDPAPAYASVADVGEGRASVVNGRSGAGVELTWDVEALPHVWLWRETTASRGVWRGQIGVLGLEPASVPHGDGLAHAIERGEATWVTRDAPLSYALTLRVLPGMVGDSGGAA